MPIRAAVMTGPGEPLAVWSLDDPELEPGGVLLETVASEVCGTDVHLHHGRLAGVPYPIVPGHVSVGRVLESRGVEQDAVGRPLGLGDVVTFLDVHETCNECYQCIIARQPNRCPHRKVYGVTYSASEGPLGGWAERIYLKPGVRILKLPDNLTADEVIGGGCGLFTCFAAVDRSGIRMGDTAVVQGSGPVGLAATAFAALSGAAEVVLVGDPAPRLAFGSKMGAGRTLSVSGTTQEERHDALMAHTDGKGADIVIEASGNPTAIPEGFGLLRDGGTYVVAGHYTDVGPVIINPHVDINRKHADVRGQWGTELHHLVRALRLLSKHRDRLPFAEVIGGRYTLDNAGDALADVEALRVTKAIVTPN